VPGALGLVAPQVMKIPYVCANHRVEK
jgi:hypothetical protein